MTAHERQNLRLQHLSCGRSESLTRGNLPSIDCRPEVAETLLGSVLRNEILIESQRFQILDARLTLILGVIDYATKSEILKIYV